MSFLSNRFPILASPLSGWLIILLGLATLLNVWVFQEPTDLPKLITWYIGIGVALVIAISTTGVKQLYVSKPGILLLVLLSVLLFLSSFFSYDYINTVFGLFPRYTNSLLFFLSWITGIVIFCLLSFKDFVKLSTYFALLAVPVAIWGIVQSFGFGYYEGLTVSIRNPAPSFLGNPNFSAMFVAIALPILIWNTRNREQWKVYLLWLCIGLCAVSLIIFNSRGAFLAIAVSGAVYVALVAAKRMWAHAIVVAAVMAVLLATGAVFYYQTRVNILPQQSVTSQETISSRLLLWDFTTDYIMRNPWTGTGLGNFFIAFRSNTHPTFASQEWFDDAHNVFLQMIATTGIITSGTLFVLFIYAFCRLYRYYRQSIDVDYALPIIAALVAWCVAASFTPVALPVWIFLAVLIAGGLHTRNTSIKVFNNRLGKVGTILCAMIFLVLGISMLISELSLWRARVNTERYKYNPAYRYSRIAITVFPFNTNAYITHMNAALHLNKYEQLEQLLTGFVDQHVNSAGIYQVAADYYLSLYHDTDEIRYKTSAYAIIDSMVARNANYTFPYRVATLHSIREKDYDRALWYARRSIVLSNTDFNSWIMLGKIEYELHNTTATIAALKKAYAIVPDLRIKLALRQLQNEADINAVPFPIQFN